MKSEICVQDLQIDVLSFSSNSYFAKSSINAIFTHMHAGTHMHTHSPLLKSRDFIFFAHSCNSALLKPLPSTQ